MSHFNAKSLTFYGVAIGSVLILFHLVSSYGENNLKARPSIGGIYRFKAENLCNNPENLVLEIQQSGIYLSGFLLPENADNVKENTNQKPFLFGKWNQSENQEFILSGLLPQGNYCNQSNKETINIKAFWEKDTLKGEIEFNSNQLNFIAKRELIDTQTGENH